MGVRENDCQISQNYILHIKFSEFYLYSTIKILVKYSLNYFDTSARFSSTEN